MPRAKLYDVLNACSEVKDYDVMANIVWRDVGGNRDIEKGVSSEPS